MGFQWCMGDAAPLTRRTGLWTWTIMSISLLAFPANRYENKVAAKPAREKNSTYLLRQGEFAIAFLTLVLLVL